MITVISNSVGTYFASGFEKEDTLGSSLTYIYGRGVYLKTTNLRRIPIRWPRQWEVTGIYVTS